MATAAYAPYYGYAPPPYTTYPASSTTVVAQPTVETPTWVWVLIGFAVLLVIIILFAVWFAVLKPKKKPEKSKKGTNTIT